MCAGRLSDSPSLNCTWEMQFLPDYRARVSSAPILPLVAPRDVPSSLLSLYLLKKQGLLTSHVWAGAHPGEDVWLFQLIVILDLLLAAWVLPQGSSTGIYFVYAIPGSRPD
jgi:hypothetical protein